MCKTGILTPSSASPHPLAWRVEIKDEVGEEVKDGMGVMAGIKLQKGMKDGVEGQAPSGRQSTHCQESCVSHTCSSLERPLIMLGTLSAHSLRILLFLKQSIS